MYDPSGRASPTAPPALFRYSRDVRRSRPRIAVEPHDQVSARGHDGAVADDALAGHREVVRHAVAAQRNVDVGRVQDLDPGARGAGLVVHRQRVGRHQLVDHQLAVHLGRHRRTAPAPVPPPPSPAMPALPPSPAAAAPRDRAAVTHRPNTPVRSSAQPPRASPRPTLRIDRPMSMLLPPSFRAEVTRAAAAVRPRCRCCPTVGSYLVRAISRDRRCRPRCRWRRPRAPRSAPG